jgi:hypothetical protein
VHGLIPYRAQNLNRRCVGVGFGQGGKSGSLAVTAGARKSTRLPRS